MINFHTFYYAQNKNIVLYQIFLILKFTIFLKTKKFFRKNAILFDFLIFLV